MSHFPTYMPPSNASVQDAEFARLRKQAALRSIPNYATMRKDELIQALAESDLIKRQPNQ